MDDIRPGMDFISSAGADGDGSGGVRLKNTRADTHTRTGVPGTFNSALYERDLLLCFFSILITRVNKNRSEFS